MSRPRPTPDVVLVPDWDWFCEVLRRKTGLDLSKYRQEQLHRRVWTLLEGRSLSSARDLWTTLDRSPTELQRFIDALAVNVTALFRDPERWQQLEDVVLPEVVRAQSNLKVWSAGCSNGAEAYSLAALLEATYPGSHRVLGTDFDSEALAQAQKGVFTEDEMRHVPNRLLPYFHRMPQGWRVDQRLRRYTRFEKHNLLADPYDAGYDLVVCRNVAIYLTDEARNELFAKLVDSLRPGGWLFLGGSERIFAPRERGLESPIPFFYRRPAPAVKRAA